MPFPTGSLVPVIAGFSLGGFSRWGPFWGNGTKTFKAFFFLDSHQCFYCCLVLFLRRQPILAGHAKISHNLCRREVFLVV